MHPIISVYLSRLGFLQAARSRNEVVSRPESCARVMTHGVLLKEPFVMCNKRGLLVLALSLLDPYSRYRFSPINISQANATQTDHKDSGNKMKLTSIAIVHAF